MTRWIRPGTGCCVLAALFATALASCGSNNSKPATDAAASDAASPESVPAGLPASTPLITLTDLQKGQLCDWMVAKFGGYGTPVKCSSADAPIISYPDQASCVSDAPSPTNTPSCQATVGQMETCLNSISPCTTYADFSNSPNCSFMTTC
jgi:hypothetical protein